ncbi:DUF2059 domain-containing protein [Sphingomicrobium lutaoense]|uniref:DUF2059 domain-containing protein n=1 Tax=Sphingomicrobium lutaoense TaxID=515949 RepID=A0A839Z1K5_9SPHN|nr:hypothetical protein [Sphingomicrobium lutaoense]MBB3764448.1 hypothetical protein [Sphingomicrobium lutaoense]
MLRSIICTLGALSLGVATPAYAETASASPQATAAVDALWPEGTSETMMEQMAGPMTDVILGSMSSLSTDQIIEMIGNQIDDEQRADMEARLSGMTLGELMAVIDPYFEERQRITMDVTFKAMAPVMIEVEPMMKARLAQAFDRHYSAIELAAANRFFATPEGSGFASKFMSTYMDPEYLAVMGEMTPKLMEVMPAAIEKVVERTSHLPPPGEGIEERLEALGTKAE